MLSICGAKILDALGKPESSAMLASACHMQPANEMFCASAAVAAIHNDGFGEAIEMVQQPVEKSPVSLTLLSMLAQFRLGRYADAIRSYETVLDLEKEPGLDAAREGPTFVYYMTSDLEKARGVVEEGLKNPNADFYLAHLYAMILFRLAHALHNQALAAVESVIRTNAKFAPAYFSRGNIPIEQGDTSGTLEDFEQAVRLDSKYPRPYYKMVQIYARMGRVRESESARKKFVEVGSLRKEEILARQTQEVLTPGKR